MLQLSRTSLEISRIYIYIYGGPREKNICIHSCVYLSSQQHFRDPGSLSIGASVILRLMP